MSPRLFVLSALAGLAPGLVAAADPDPTGVEAEAFTSLLGRFPDQTTEAFLGTLPDPGFLASPDLDPGKASHYAMIKSAFGLGPAHEARLKAQGFVTFDGGERYSMASIYQHLYMKDLPVLVTTDSVLHALHTSFDQVLMRLEAEVFVPVIRDVLMKARDAVVAEAGSPPAPEALDAELYLTVALNLLRGAGGPADEPYFGGWNGTIAVVSALQQDEAVLAILRKVQALELEQAPGTTLYGGTRAVDWSQFRPRGHYTKSPDLQAYFRGMMWLGRADTGLNVTTPPAGSTVDADRERRVAGRLVLALAASGGTPRLAALDDVIGFLVGQSDNLQVGQLAGLLAQVGVKTPADLADPKRDAALKTQLFATGLAAQRIRSQWVLSMPADPQTVQPPALFQVFGQRFLLDSFILSQVVFDSIHFQGQKQKRFMPTGLDVWAALGNDEAARLLQPELDQWHYAANLSAARALVGAWPQATWDATLYHRWLDALRTLDDLPTDRAGFPRAMQTRAWARKQLQTQLGSWAELRHDTILYGKQSYSAMAGCEYPAGFVEPYPVFYRKLADLARFTGKRLGGAKLESPGHAQIENLIGSQVRYFETLAGHLDTLARLADRELAGQPFTAEETAWLKKTIDKSGGGSGPPRYDGWYAELFYGKFPDEWDPTVADVHTDTNAGTVLEVAVGDAWPMVVLVDSGDDVQAYVGPTYSYYEFQQPARDRLTDEAWQQRIYDRKLPPRPAWTTDLRPAP
ncbi:MAG: DUF3160 domain-containing protein [bacterium]